LRIGESGRSIICRTDQEGELGGISRLVGGVQGKSCNLGILEPEVVVALEIMVFNHLIFPIIEISCQPEVVAATHFRAQTR